MHEKNRIESPVPRSNIIGTGGNARVYNIGNGIALRIQNKGEDFEKNTGHQLRLIRGMLNEVGYWPAIHLPILTMDNEDISELADGDLFGKTVRVKLEEIKDAVGFIIAMHEKGYIHGDMKSENILFFQSEEGTRLSFTDWEFISKEVEDRLQGLFSASGDDKDLLPEGYSTGEQQGVVTRDQKRFVECWNLGMVIAENLFCAPGEELERVKLIAHLTQTPLAELTKNGDGKSPLPRDEIINSIGLTSHDPKNASTEVKKLKVGLQSMGIDGRARRASGSLASGWRSSAPLARLKNKMQSDLEAMIVAQERQLGDLMPQLANTSSEKEQVEGKLVKEAKEIERLEKSASHRYVSSLIFTLAAVGAFSGLAVLGTPALLVVIVLSLVGVGALIVGALFLKAGKGYLREAEQKTRSQVERLAMVDDKTVKEMVLSRQIEKLNQSRQEHKKIRADLGNTSGFLAYMKTLSTSVKQRFEIVSGRASVHPSDGREEQFKVIQYGFGEEDKVLAGEEGKRRDLGHSAQPTAHDASVPVGGAQGDDSLGAPGVTYSAHALGSDALKGNDPAKGPLLKGTGADHTRLDEDDGKLEL